MNGLSARTRLLAALAVGGVGWVIAALLLPWQVTLVVGWDAAAAAWIASVLLTIVGRDAEATAAVATREDDSRAAADLVLLGAGVASLVGVVLTLLKASHYHGAAHAGTTAVAGLTVVLSWAAVHLLFTLRYARLYYTEGGGIDYHDDRKADYLDFAYVAFTVGMTYQVSDTDLVSRTIRRTALRHALLSYLFGTGVVAVTINVVAGLLSK